MVPSLYESRIAEVLLNIESPLHQVLFKEDDGISIHSEVVKKKSGKQILILNPSCLLYQFSGFICIVIIRSLAKETNL